MSIWKDNGYEARKNSLVYPDMNVRSYVSDHIKEFVGTKAQIEAEEIRLMEVAKEIAISQRNEYYNKLNEIVDEWVDELYETYLGKGYPVELHNKVYSIAYERGHSSGYCEVENYYINLSEDFAFAFDLGIKSVEK